MRKENIPFYIRIKNGALVKENNKDKNAWAIKQAFSYLNNKEQGYLSETLKIYSNTLHVAAGRPEKGELMIVVTNQNPKDAVNHYLKRWGIETLFHMTRHERIAKLMTLLTVGFAGPLSSGNGQLQKK